MCICPSPHQTNWITPQAQATACITSTAMRCTAAALLLLLAHFTPPPFWVVAQKADRDLDDDCCVVDSACLTGLALTAQKDASLLGSFKNASTAVLSCVGTQSAVVRPLRLLLPDYTESLMVSFLPIIENAIGWEVECTYAPADDVGALVLDTQATGRAFYDGWITETSWTLELANQGMMEPLDNYVNADPQIEWLDVARFPRTSAAVFNGSIIGVPVGGFMYLMHWRKDVFARAGLVPPQTWREAIAIARALNGTDFNQDGQADHALCLDMFNSSSNDPSSLLNQILASQTQTQGTGDGWLFSPQTMESFVDSPAMTEALDIVSQLLLYSSNYSRYDLLTGHPLVKGTCAMHIATTAIFKAMAKGPFKGQFGSVSLPGSEVVLDRTTGQLVECSPELCPFAIWVNLTTSTAAGGQPQPPLGPRLVNRASYSGYCSILGMINANSMSVYKAATYRGLALFSSYKITLQSNASLALWTSRGYNKADVAGYLSAMQATLDHPNNALDLRIEHATDYRLALENAAMSLVDRQNNNVASVQSVLSARFKAIAATSSLQELGDGYLAGLNVKHRFTLPLHPPPPPPPTTAPPTTTTTSGLSAGQEMGIVIGSVLGALLLVLVAVVMVVARGRTHRRWGLFGMHLPPGVGVGTTLVVTDIENSTLLWENIQPEAMNIALELHHTLVRKLLLQHQGYESATEGDSFIVAFHTPLDALKFTQAFQAGLLLQDWPAEVLACNLACPVWVQPRGVLDKSERGKLSGSFIGTAVAGTIAAVRTTLDGKPMAARTSVTGSPLRTTLDVRARESLNGSPLPLFSLNGAAGVKAQSPARPATPKQRSMLMQALHSEASQHGSTNSISGNRTPNVSINGAPSPQQQPSGPQTALSALVEEWRECDAPLPGENAQAQGKRLAYRGLRVRVGLHSGLGDPRDTLLNATTGRMQYSGPLLYTAKAVGDCGHGGMVLLSHACFTALPSASLQSMGLVLNMGEFSFTKPGGSEVVRPCALYQVVADDMQHRLPLMDYKLRSVTQLQVGVLQAPVNHACIAFANVVGAASLMAWDSDVASRALALYQRKAVEMLLANDVPMPTDAGAAHDANVLSGANVLGGAQGLSGTDAFSGTNALSGADILGVDLILGGAGGVPMVNGTGTAPDARLVLGGSGGGDGVGSRNLQPPGYVVELAGGLCLAAFQTPASALLWALRLVEGLLVADWEAELLVHELCEEMRIGGGGSCAMMKRSPHGGDTQQQKHGEGAGGDPEASNGLQQRFASSPGGEHASTRFTRLANRGGVVLFRGLRLKIGVDLGSVHANINPCTGRMAYRGRVMNRTARIADKAGSGQVWCSKAVVDSLEATAGREGTGVDAHPLGSFNLKGVTEPVELMQCVLQDSFGDEW